MVVTRSSSVTVNRISGTDSKFIGENRVSEKETRTSSAREGLYCTILSKTGSTKAK